VQAGGTRTAALARAPRSVVGYHGCSAGIARRLLEGEPFRRSANAWDWLGEGIYFWEYAPFRAREWAEQLAPGDAAVIEGRIRLGRCLNLLDIEHSGPLRTVYEETAEALAARGEPVPVNTRRGAHFLDRSVIDTYCRLAARHTRSPYQTVRACFPEGEPVYAGSKILTRTHVQIAVRDERCLSHLRLVSFGEE